MESREEAGRGDESSGGEDLNRGSWCEAGTGNGALQH